MKTYAVKASEIERSWWVVDATDQTLGRLATRIATLLEGKHKPIYSPHLDTGDHVVVLNAGGARFTKGDPITMTAGDVVAVAAHAPSARVVAVHLEAINHCLESRAELHRRLRDEGLEGRVTVPEDGAAVAL